MVKRYRRQPGDIKRFKSIKADEYKEDVAKLRALRKAARLTQRALAALLGESQTYITNVERRVRRIDVYEARRWEQACREYTAKEALRRALEVFAAFEVAARAARSKPPVLPTVADGASTSQPKGIGLPLAADALGGHPPATAAGDIAAAPLAAPRADTPAQSDRDAPALESRPSPDDGAAPPRKPERE